MKNIFTLVILASLLTVINCSSKNSNAKEQAAIDDKGFAVVELFTSEGCSSCPPADELFTELAKAHKENVYLLAFHVDYWDRLGWKDLFSNPAYSDRQRRYAVMFEKEGVYTPQTIINGHRQLVGSDEAGLHSAIKSELSANVNHAAVISTEVRGRTIAVLYKTEPITGTQLNIALVQSHAVSNVQRGENKGRILHHVNIVRDFKTVSIEQATGSIELTLPAGVEPADCNIISFTQDSATLKITGATATALQ